jgi:hypothetical protein
VSGPCGKRCGRDCFAGGNERVSVVTCVLGGARVPYCKEGERRLRLLANRHSLAPSLPLLARPSVWWTLSLARSPFGRTRTRRPAASERKKASAVVGRRFLLAAYIWPRAASDKTRGFPRIAARTRFPFFSWVCARAVCVFVDEQTIRVCRTSTRTAIVDVTCLLLVRVFFRCANSRPLCVCTMSELVIVGDPRPSIRRTA